MPGAHSVIGPSNAHRWRRCAGSVEESHGLPDDAGEEAFQGTVFHEVADIVVETGIPPHLFIGQEYEIDDGTTRPFTKEMATKMLPGLDLIGAYEQVPGSISRSEIRVDLGPWLGDGMFGTSDYANVSVALRRIVVFDWKWGTAVPVSPEWNDQAICYALGVWTTFAEELFEGIEPAAIEVVVIIEQPRAPGGGGVWRTNMATLLAEGKVIAKQAAATREKDALRTPGPKQCQFCPAAKHNTCTARAEWIMETLDIRASDLLDGEPDDPLLLPDRRALTPEQRSRVLLNAQMIRSFLSTLHDEAMNDAEMGRPVPGMKRVRGRAPARKWSDPDKIEPILEARMGEEAWLKKLRSPAQVEEEVGKAGYREEWERHVTRGTPGAELVPEDDKRDALPSVDDLLDAEEEDEDYV